jgi:hypothetical protein
MEVTRRAGALGLACLRNTVHGFSRGGSYPLSSARGGKVLSMGAGRKDAYRVTLLPGDGIGPEIMAATVGVLNTLGNKLGFTLSFEEALIGGVAIDAVNDPFPDETLRKCQASDSVLLA